MFPTDDLLQSEVAKNFESDLTTLNSKIFFNIQYEAINIYGVKINGELKFYTTAYVDKTKSKILFTEPTNVSNWIGLPDLSENSDDKEKADESDT